MVGEHQAPMPHLGGILGMATWQILPQKLAEAGLAFGIAPTLEFVGEPGEQGTMFVRDPSVTPIEIKGLANLARV